MKLAALEMDVQVKVGDISCTPQHLKPGFSGYCSILNSNIPGRFWIRLEEEASQILRAEMDSLIEITYSTIMNGKEFHAETNNFCWVVDAFLQEIYENENDKQKVKEAVNDYLATIGDYGILFLTKEKKFVRVFIVETCDLSVVVMLIDEGLFLKAPLQLLWPMSKELVKYPHFAVSCYLHDLYPDKSCSNPNGPWPRRSVMEFQHLLSEHSQWRLQICEKSESFPKGMLSVSLSEGSIKVNEYLLGNDYAYSLNPINTTGETEDCFMDDFNPMVKEYFSARNQYHVNSDDPGVAIYGYAGKDEQKICLQYLKNGRCYKGLSCFKEHVGFHPSGYTTDTEPFINKTSQELPQLEVGKAYDVSQINVKTYCSFYITLASEIEEYKDRMAKIHQYMNDDKVSSKWKMFDKIPMQSELLLVKKNNIWQRGKCLDTDSDGVLSQVLLADEGEIITVPGTDLRIMEPELAHVPFLSRFCQLTNIEPSQDNTADDVSQKLRDFLADEPSLKIEVEAVHDGLWVDLIDHEGKSLSARLIESGVADRCYILAPSDESPFLPG